MPDLKLAIPALGAIAALVLVATMIGFLLDHPAVLILGIVAVAGLIVFLARRSAARNRV